MKVKITQRGYEGFTGQMGVTMFKDAVSVDDVPAKEAFALSAIFSVVDAETGEDIGLLAQEKSVWDSSNIEHAPKLMTRGQRMAGGVAQGNPQKRAQAPVVTVKALTRDELEAIADKGGIAAVRKIGEPLGLKGTSIAKLIEDILAAQPQSPVAEPASEPVVDEVVVDEATGDEDDPLADLGLDLDNEDGK